MIYDINLIPKTRKKVSNEAIFVTSALSLCCVAVIIYLGFFLPFQQKSTLSKQISDQENELLSYSDTQEQYFSLINQVEEISRTALTLDSIKSSNLKMTEIINDIESTTPKNIKIKTMSLSGGLLTMEGRASSYQEIAEYIVNLRNVENVQGITFTNATRDEGIGEVAIEEATIGENTLEKIPEGNTDNVKQFHNFTLYVNLNVTDVLTGLLAEQAADISNAGEETIQNETN